MNDYEYEFKQDIKEKKSVGRNSRYMNRTGKGPIKFPSDYLSNKEKKKLNGSVISYDMGKPMSYEQLIMMPEDLQRLYLQGLMDKFHPSQRALAELFGCSKNRIAYRMREFGIKPAGESRGGKNPYFDEKAWDAWIADGKLPEEPAKPKKTDKSHTEKHELEEKVPLVHTSGVVIPDVIPDPNVIEVKEFPKVGENALREVGLPDVDFITVSKLWSSYRNETITPTDVAAMFALTKLADISTGKATSQTWKDLAKYAMRASEL